MKSIFTNIYIVTAIERFGLMAIKIASIVVLSRFISPSDFGVYSIITAIVAFSTLLVDSGMGGALIREKNPTDDDYSTVFTSNIFVSSMLFIALVGLSGLLGDLYNDSRIPLAISAVSVTILIKSLTIIHVVRMTRVYNFSGQAKINLISALVAFFCSLYLARNGFGLWSLIYQQIIESALSAFGFIFVNRSFPKIVFKFESFKKLFGFGFSLTLSSLVKSAYENLSILILAKSFSMTSIGYYGQANRINSLYSSFVAGVLDKSSYGRMSQYFHEDKKIFIEYCNRLLLGASLAGTIVTYIIFVWADELIRVTLGSNWSESAWMLKIMSIAGAALIYDSVFRIILKASGNSLTILFSEIIKKIVSITLLVFLLSNGFEIVLYGMSAAAVISLIIGSYYAAIKAGYRTSEQISAVTLPLLSLVITHLSFFGYKNIFIINLMYEKILTILATFVFYFVVYFSLKKLHLGNKL